MHLKVTPSLCSGVALVTLVLIANGCATEVERKCRYDPESVSPAECYAAGRSEGYDAGLDAGVYDGAAKASEDCSGPTDAAAAGDSTALGVASTSDSTSSADSDAGCGCGDDSDSGGETASARSEVRPRWSVVLGFLPIYALWRRPRRHPVPRPETAATPSQQHQKPHR